MKDIILKYRNEKSLNGYTFDVLKSALQKYIRRSNGRMAIYSAIELFFFECITPADEGASKIQKSLYTNFIHRLMITYLEDQGMAALNLWTEFDQNFDVLLNKKEDKIKRLEYLLNMVYSFAKNHHTRIPSHFNSIYNTFFTEDLELREKNRKILDKYMIYFPTVNQIKNSIDVKIKKGDNKDPKFLQNQLALSLQNKELDAFFWAKLIDNLDIPKKGRKNDEISKVKLIFDTIQKIYTDKGIDSSGFFDVYKKWYLELYNLKERFLTYYIPIIVTVLDKVAKGDTYEVKNIKTMIKSNLIKEPRKFDDFVYDMHTKIGKQKGKGAKEFVKEGSYVEDDANFFPELHRFYNFSKLLLNEGIEDKEYLVDEILDLEEDEIPIKKPKEKDKKVIQNKIEKESDRFEFIIRAQLVCSNHRQDTYFAKDKLNDKIVFVKGPFLNEEQVDYAIKITELRKDLGERFVKMEKVMLIPDLLDSPISQRNFTSTNKAYPFLISENLCEEEFKVKIRNSKMWPDTEVVDWDKMKRCKVFNPLKVEDDLFRKYVKHLLFRKVIKVGDLADRNFILKDDKIVYSIDEDSIPGENKKIEIYKDLRKQRANKVRNFIENNKEYFENVLNEWKGKIKDENFLKNLESINLDDLDK